MTKVSERLRAAVTGDVSGVAAVNVLLGSQFTAQQLRNAAVAIEALPGVSKVQSLGRLPMVSLVTPFHNIAALERMDEVQWIDHNGEAPIGDLIDGQGAA